MLSKKPAKPQRTLNKRRPELNGIVPITKFLIDVNDFDFTPIPHARTQKSILIPRQLLDHRDLFLQSIHTTDAIKTWANAFVALQKLTHRISTDQSANLDAKPKPIDTLNSDTLSAPLLPANKKAKPTLVLDLDSTLFYASSDILNTPLEYYDMGEDVPYRYLYLRPHALDFLSWASKAFEVVIWTAAVKSYAQPRITRAGIDKYADIVLYREACDLISGSLIKNLAKLGRPLSDLIIVDDNPISYALNVELAYPIPAFTGEEDDLELLRLVPFLRKALELSSLKRGIYRTIFKDSSMHRALETLGQYKYASDS